MHLWATLCFSLRHPGPVGMGVIIETGVPHMLWSSALSHCIYNLIASVSASPEDDWNLASNYRTVILQIPPTFCVTPEFHLTLFYHKTFCRLLEFNFLVCSKLPQLWQSWTSCEWAWFVLSRKKPNHVLCHLKHWEAQNLGCLSEQIRRIQYSTITENIDETNH